MTFTDSKGNYWNYYPSIIKADKSNILFPDEFKNEYNIMDITEDSHGSIWVVSSKKIHTYTDGKWSATTYPQILKDKVITNLVVDKKDNIWASAITKEDSSRGAGLFVRINGQWKSYQPDGPKGYAFSQVTLDGNGNLWFDGGGFKLLNIRTLNGKWKVKKLGGNRITALETDSLGNVWAASASRYAPWDENMGIFTPSLSVGGCGVTVFFKDGKDKNVSGIKGGYISAMAQGPQGKVWMAVNNSSESIDPVSISMHRKDGTWLHIPYKSYNEKLNKFNENNRDIKAIAAEPKGNVWIGTSVGLKLRKLNGTLQNVPLPGFKTTPGIKALVLENGKNLWISVKNPIYLDTGYGVMVRYPNGSWKKYSTKDGLVDDSVNCIFIDKQGNKWFATNGGVSTLSKEGTWHSYTTKDGLADNKVYGITQDKNGDYWFATNGGISQLKTEIGS